MKIDLTDEEFELIQISLGFLVKTMYTKETRLKLANLQMKMVNQAIEELETISDIKSKSHNSPSTRQIPVAPSGSMIYEVVKGSNLI